MDLNISEKKCDELDTMISWGGPSVQILRLDMIVTSGRLCTSLRASIKRVGFTLIPYYSLEIVQSTGSDITSNLKVRHSVWSSLRLVWHQTWSGCVTYVTSCHSTRIKVCLGFVVPGHKSLLDRKISYLHLAPECVFNIKHLRTEWN